MPLELMIADDGILEMLGVILCYAGFVGACAASLGWLSGDVGSSVPAWHKAHHPAPGQPCKAQQFPNLNLSFGRGRAVLTSLQKQS